MTVGAGIWMIVFAVAAIIYIGIAIFVSVKGFSDLKDLLRSPRRETRK